MPNGLTLVHAHDDVNVVREARLSEHHRGDGTGGESLTADAVELLPDKAQQFGGFHQPRASEPSRPAILRAVSAANMASDQSGCCAFTPQRTSVTAERHIASSAASRAPGDCNLRAATMTGSQRSSAGWDMPDECMGYGFTVSQDTVQIPR